MVAFAVFTLVRQTSDLQGAETASAIALRDQVASGVMCCCAAMHRWFRAATVLDVAAMLHRSH